MTECEFQEIPIKSSLDFEAKSMKDQQLSEEKIKDIEKSFSDERYEAGVEAYRALKLWCDAHRKEETES